MTPLEINQIRMTLNQRPEDINAIHAQAKAYLDNGHPGSAYHLYARAVEMTDATNAMVLRGLAASELLLAAYAGDEEWFPQAEAAAARALEIEGSADSMLLFAGCIMQTGRYDAAEPMLRAALGLEDRADAHQLIAQCLMFRDAFGEAWDHYERHLGFAQRWIQPEPDAPYWKGEPTEHLLVIGEQGIGDEISFASMAPDAANDVMNFTLYCDPRLTTLFAQSFDFEVQGLRKTMLARPGSLVEILAQPSPPLSARCLSGSLAKYYRRTIESFPRTAFLQADQERVDHWRKQLDELPGKKIGLAYTGGKAPSYWHRRGLYWSDILALTQGMDATWVSLQYDPVDAGLVTWLAEHGVNLVTFETNAADYSDTAALVMALDDVVTATTAIAHLCGALGKRAHVFVPEIARPFYGRTGTESRWYSSLVLHRQRDGAWPIDEVKEALA